MEKRKVDGYKYTCIERGSKMNKIYEVEGIVNKGFVGQISYNICLDKEFSDIDIEFSFNKQKVLILTDEIKNDLIQYSLNEYNEIPSEEELIELSKKMKTEIQISAFLNDKFIGGIHKQLSSRNMRISSNQISDGAIEQEIISGNIKINIIVFNVLYDNTHYKLTLRGNSKGE